MTENTTGSAPRKPGEDARAATALFASRHAQIESVHFAAFVGVNWSLIGLGIQVEKQDYDSGGVTVGGRIGPFYVGVEYAR